MAGYSVDNGKRDCTLLLFLTTEVCRLVDLYSGNDIESQVA